MCNHAGVNMLVGTLRNNYWIIGARKMCKTIAQGCLTCKRFTSKPCNQSPAPLPEFRIKPTDPFTIIGVDYAGPVFCADQPGKKLYILIFTCAVIRALHIELTDSLNVEDCKLAKLLLMIPFQILRVNV